MKTKISRIGKRSLSIVLTMMLVVSMMLVGMVSANAFSIKSGAHFYFNNSHTNWNYTNVYFVYGNNSAYMMNKMSKVTNTDLYYYKLSTNWSDITYIGVFASNSDWCNGNQSQQENNQYSNITTYADAATNSYNGNFDFGTSGMYLLNTSGGTASNGVYKKGSTISPTYISELTGLNSYDQTVQIQVDGKTVTQNIASIKISSYYISAHGVATNGTSTSTNGKATYSCAAGATTKLTYSNKLEGYTFQGWKKSGSSTITSGSSLTYYPDADMTYYACFTKDTTSNKVNLTQTSNGNISANITDAEPGDEVIITATPNDGYECTGMTVTPTVPVNDNKDGTYSFTMPSSDVTVSATFTKVVTTNWYLSGTLEYVDGHNPKYFNIDTVASSYKMTAEGTNTYTYTYTYPSDVKKFYVVVNDGTNAYHPFDADKGSGAPYNPDVTNKVFAGSPSWYPEFTAGDTVKFTWNVSTGTLSWVKISDTTYTVSADSNLQTGASITFSATAGGESTNTFKENDTVFVTVTNPEGYDCTGVSTSPSVNVNKNSDGTYSFKMPANNVTVSATFTKQLESGAYTITKSTSPFGTMTLKNSSELKEGTANAGDTITVTVNAIKGYACKTLTASTQSGDVTVTANDDGTYTFTMPEANVTLTATFEVTEITYTLKSTVANATVTFSTASSSNAKTAKPGEKVTVTITPKSGYICDYYAVLDMYDNALECERLSSVKCTFIMPECDVTVTAAMKEYIPEANHTFRVYFKSPSAFAYQPKVSVNGGSYTSMIKDQELGKIYSGALTIYWYYIVLTVDTSTATTLTFKTNRTSLNASITDYFTSTEYYLAVDDMMSGKEVVDLTSMPEYVRNYYRSATHMVYPYSGASDDTDNTLGFTNINGVRYKMGEYIKDHKVSIMSATLMQKVSVQAETVDDVQMALLDVNLDGRVDVRDATLTQKYLVSE